MTADRKPAGPTLCELAHECRTAMAHDRKVQLVLRPNGSVSGKITAIREDLAAKPDCLKARPNTRSHLRVMLGDAAYDIERIREVRPAF